MLFECYSQISVLLSVINLQKFSDDTAIVGCVEGRREGGRLMLHSCGVGRSEFPSWQVVVPTSLCSCAVKS